MSSERQRGQSARPGTIPGSTGACVVMAAGFGVPKEPGTDRFAGRFQEAGFGVLAFDYRRFGGSGGRPRQVVRLRDQLADWSAALGAAASLPDVEPTRLAAWGFSAVRRPCRPDRRPDAAAGRGDRPDADGRRSVATRNAGRYQTKPALARTWGAPFSISCARPSGARRCCFRSSPHRGCRRCSPPLTRWTPTARSTRTASTPTGPGAWPRVRSSGAVLPADPGRRAHRMPLARREL